MPLTLTVVYNISRPKHTSLNVHDVHDKSHRPSTVSSLAVFTGLMGTEDSPEDGEDPEAEVDKETIHRLCPTYATDINSPLRHVRTRIYFTSESHVHSLINVLRFSHLAGRLCSSGPALLMFLLVSWAMACGLISGLLSWEAPIMVAERRTLFFSSPCTLCPQQQLLRLVLLLPCSVAAVEQVADVYCCRAATHSRIYTSTTCFLAGSPNVEY